MATSSSTVAETSSRKTMTSTCSPEMDQCSHVFEIHGYTLHAEGLGVGRSLRSATFAVGGHDWRISYYPDGHDQNSSGFASVFLDFMGNQTCPAGTKVNGFVSLDLIHPITGEAMYMRTRGSRINIKHTVLSPNTTIKSWGYGMFIPISLLQTWPLTYLHGDSLAVECNLSVVVGSRVSSGGPPESERAEIPVPPPQENLGRLLLGAKEGVDVTFMVQGVVFHAHKVVLAARSPVFKAELYGLIGEQKTKNMHRDITIQDMEPGVFKALLHFIYTDSLPSANDNDGDCDLDDEGVVKHLLVAADRYAMDRMRLMCESILCKRISVENLAATLALADQHYCCKLKDACVSFMSSRKRIRDVMATKGYKQLKKTCPSVAMVLLEEAVKSSVC